MTGTLEPRLRRELENACVNGRRASEAACRAALGVLGVAADRVPEHLDGNERKLRVGLRAKARQLGDTDGSIELLVGECAYEQWHRLLFARFLAVNDLLIHPEYKVPVTLSECDELAPELGEPDGWSVAGRFATEILPGIFRLGDPAVQLPLAPEDRQRLEGIVDSLPEEVFKADDGLGWVYQFWQRDKKDEVNASERRIGGADLGPVTQLFTEPYMVKFLLQNSLGAWWAARHPDSELAKEWEYLRFDDNGNPAAGLFEQWPERAAEVTVMDPCCGSGHFLIEAFSMLWRMREEEDGLPAEAAQDAVLEDNLFGLELDPRCVQIAMFAVALQAWRAGRSWRQLPVPHIACSGIPVKTPVEEWAQLASGDTRLEEALRRLHTLFRNADSLGSLNDPKQAVEIADPTGLQSSLQDVALNEVAPLMAQALLEEGDDPALAVLGADAASIAHAVDYLSRKYTLVATNVPYLGTQKLSEFTAFHLERKYPDSWQDLATVFVERCLALTTTGSAALVTPLSWLYLKTFSNLRKSLLEQFSWNVLAPLGKDAFGAISGEVVQSSLLVLSSCGEFGKVLAINASEAKGPNEKSNVLKAGTISPVIQSELRDSPDTLLAFGEKVGELLSKFATSWQGLVTSDVARYIIKFWELPQEGREWERYVTAPTDTKPYSGRESLLRWENGSGALVRTSGAHNFNPTHVLGRKGVLIGQGSLRATLYLGEMFNDASSPIVPKNPENLLMLWAYASSPEYKEKVRRINHKVVVGCGYLIKVPFDVDRWREEAAEIYPNGLPEPWSDDPTQWLFEGRPEESTEPLQVAVGRLLGYRWPEQPDADDIDEMVDEDGIVCLPSVQGERSAANRLQELLARAYGTTWSPGKTVQLLLGSGSTKKDLESWLRDDFFKAHCKVFKNRPFIWHIYDGRKDGFAALVNYHRLDRATFERLTFTYLGDWIERQTAGMREDVLGAEERLAAARDLQRRLELILEGEDPYDIYVRWKSLAEQPVGWEPDLNDGVRLNVRPFVEAGVLRSKFSVKWGKDRRNDLHFTLADKEAARLGTGS